MYTASAIRFRDPFVSRELTPPASATHHESTRAGWTSSRHFPDFVRSITPPADMNSVQHFSSMPGYYQHQYGDNMTGNQVHHARTAPYPQGQYPHANVGSHEAAHLSVTSPLAASRSAAVQDIYSRSHSRRSSYNNTIAANFQIPKSVNDTGGSLSELAAQITCLFWFESWELLQQIEDSPVLLCPTRQLVSDARPSTGFRKWVATILSTTCVAQNVVLLALSFIYRLKKLNPTVRGKPGSEYRLLTVALMLGNKFLDDNTYTNKTWADVSGINVGEVHIMEVEFLSNMKYCLFTSEQDWTYWQSLLGKFAAFFDRATRPQPPPPPSVPALPPASSLQWPVALASPPSSNQASPPYLTDMPQNGSAYGVTGQHGPTPAPSLLGDFMDNSGVPSLQRPRKRSYEGYSTEPPAKRVAGAYQNHTSPQRYSNTASNPNLGQPVNRLKLPSLSIPATQTPFGPYAQPSMQGHSLPPLNVPARAMAMVYPSNTSTPSQILPLTATAGTSSQTHSQVHSRQASRHQSPYPVSATASPNAAPLSATALNPPTQISPTYFLRQRNSPYRPVHHVSTLLYPPPSAAMQQQSANIELNQMRYQPLGKRIQHQQTGRLPYVAQNLWVDGNHAEVMTPVHQWPNFSYVQQLQPQSHLSIHH